MNNKKMPDVKKISDIIKEYQERTRQETEEKIVSSLKEKIKEVQDAGDVIEVIYCSATLYSYIRNMKEHFEEATTQQSYKDGIFGKFLSIDLAPTSYAKGRVIFSSSKHIQEEMEKMLPQDSYATHQEYRDAYKRIATEYIQKAKVIVDENKILELEESDILQTNNTKKVKNEVEAREVQRKYDDSSHGMIQWKGTGVCMDVYCKQCGLHSHIDDEFVYFLICPKCDTKYYCNPNIELIAIDEFSKITSEYCIKENYDEEYRTEKIINDAIEKAETE